MCLDSYSLLSHLFFYLNYTICTVYLTHSYLYPFSQLVLRSFFWLCKVWSEPKMDRLRHRFVTAKINLPCIINHINMISNVIQILPNHSNIKCHTYKTEVLNDIFFRYLYLNLDILVPSDKKISDFFRKPISISKLYLDFRYLVPSNKNNIWVFLENHIYI